MATEREYSLMQPGMERLAEQRLTEMLAGNYTPVQQAWFQKAMNPQMARLQQMGILRSGGAGRTLGAVGGDLAAQLQQQALQGALGLGGQQRGYEQWGKQLGLQRYGMEGGWEQQAAEREMQKEIARRQQKGAFWSALGGIGGGLLSSMIPGGGLLKGLMGGLGSKGGASSSASMPNSSLPSYSMGYHSPY